MTMRTMLRSKIHRAKVTEVNVSYEGSITIDKILMEAADMLPYEKVDVLNINNGARFSTYVIEGEKDSGVICLNGAAARLATKDDIVIILTYDSIPENEAQHFKPKIVLVNSKNQLRDQNRENSPADSLLSQI